MMNVKFNLLSLAVCVLPLYAAEKQPQDETSPALSVQSGAYHPFFRAALYPSWSAMTPKQAVADTEAAVQLAFRHVDAICALTPEQMTFENTFLAYGKAVEELEQSQQYLHHLISVRNDRTLQQVQNYLMGALTQFDARLLENERLWLALKTASQQPWIQELTAEDKRLVEQTLRHFRLGGAELSPEDKKRKAAIHHELGVLAMRYGHNVQAASAEWSLLITDAEQLRGLPEQKN